MWDYFLFTKHNIDDILLDIELILHPFQKERIMSKIYKSIDELIGSTPLLELNNIKKEFSLNCTILAKLESFNPGGSAKDRIAKNMIDEAEKSGKLKVGATIIEPTSGNTGIGLSLIAASRGYNVIIVMPDTMSKERIMLMKAYGAKVILTDGKKGMKGSIEKANELLNEIPNSFLAGQFENTSNPDAHYKTTGPEIYNDTDGKIDAFISAVGTGGTITGAGKFLKEKLPDIKIIAVEPTSSPVLSKRTAGSHKIQGIGAGFIPEVLDTEIYDEIITVSDEDAYKMTATLGRLEGVLSGISSGAALNAAIEYAKRPENTDKTIVVLLPDTGERYLSSGVFG